MNTLFAAFTTGKPVVAYTLQGMGGVGKTATAKKLAAKLIPHFAGGIFWGALSDYDGNPGPILRNWGRICYKELPFDLDSESLAHIIRGILATRQSNQGRLLFIIDDIREKWLETAKLLKQAIPHGASLLMTARNEIIAAALDTETYRLEEMHHDEAVQLLEAYARTSMIAAERESAATLVKVVGYLPLAIELAGKRLSFLSHKPGVHLKELCQAVEKRAVEILNIPGHKGLAATFAITYEALSYEEQHLFRWLSIFAEGPLDSIDIAGVLKVNVSEAENLLDNLVASALLAWGETKGKYTLHPLLRQYAQTLLHTAAEANEAGQQHLDYYLALTHANEQESPIAHAKLEANLPNILRSIDFAAKVENHDAVNKFILALWSNSSFLPMRGYIRLALDLLPKAIIACRKLGDRFNESIHLGDLGVVHSNLGPAEKAIDYHNQALIICRETGDRYNECAHLGNLGMIYSDTGQIELAIECYQEAMNIAGETSNFEVALDQLGHLGSAYRHLGMTKAAKKCYAEGIALSQKKGRRRSEGNNLSNLGLTYYDLKFYGLAWSYIGQALAISIEISDRRGEGNRLGHLGNIFSNMGMLEKSIECYKQAIDISREIGHRANEGNWLGNLGNVHRYLGKIDMAIEYYQQALAISQELNFLEGQGIWLLNLGISYRDNGQIQKARQNFLEALNIFRINKSRNIKEAEDLLAKLGGGA